MKKRLILIYLILSVSPYVFAQFYTHPSNGRIGIGTTSPAVNFHVNSAASTYLMVEKPNNTFQAGLQFRRGGTTRFWLYSDATSDALKIKANVSGETDALPRMEFPLDNKNIYIGLSGGMVGINTNAPSEILDVNGALRVRSLSQADSLNQVMVSDANGKIFWRDAFSITSSLPFIANGTSLGVGNGALLYSTNHDGNTAFGVESLEDNSGVYNTAHGYQSLRINTTGSGNTALGYKSLSQSTEGSGNIAIGVFALSQNTTGNSNTALGQESCNSNTSGSHNTAAGAQSFSSNTTGSQNTAHGASSLGGNTTGNYNSAFGLSSMQFNSTGEYNTAVGANCLRNITVGTQNTAVGYAAGPTANDLNNTTAIGANARPTASDQIRIGNSSVTSIGGQVSWSTFSDGRFKKELREDVAGLEFIRQLKPVSYKVDKDAINAFLGLPTNVEVQGPSSRRTPSRETGFVAQEVEDVIKKTGFVFNGVEAPQNDKDHYSIRYAEFVVPLVKAVQELSTIIEDQQKQIDLLTKMLTTAEIIEPFKGLQLHQNQPNPFQRDTKITMFIPEEVQVATLYVYDLQGKKVEKLEVNERGSTSVTIGGGRFSSGIYLYTLIGDSQATDVKRMILTE